MTPEQFTTLKAPTMLREGDYLLIGKRKWIYECRTEDVPELKHFQNEYRFYADDPENGALGHYRVHSQSEIEAFAEAGFLYRMVPSRIKFVDDEKVTR